MRIYFIVFLLTLLLAIFLPAKNDKGLRWKLVLVFIPLFFFGALRVDMGNDYHVYELFFDEFHGSKKFVFDKTAHAEIGYQFLCYIMPSYRSILILNSFLLCFAFASFIYHNVPKRYIWVAILLLFLNVEKNIYGSMVGLRNGFAVTTFLLGSVFIQRRKLIPFILITVVSVSFHTSAIFYLPIAYLIGRGTKFSKTEIWIWVITLGVLGTMNSAGLMKSVTPFLLDYFERYENYILDFTDHQGVMMVITTIVLFTLICTICYNNKVRLGPKQLSLCRLGLLYLASLFLGTISMRAAFFYNIFFTGTVALLFSIKGKYEAWGRALCAIAIIMSAYSMYLWMHASHVYNNPLYTVYHSILD